MSLQNARQLADAVRSFTLNPETARFWGNVLIGGIGLVCIANLNFILVFIQRRKDANFETLRWFFVILPPMTLITLVPTNLYTQGADLFYWGWEAEIHGLVHKLFFLYIALYVIYGITMITRANLTISKGAAAKTRLQPIDITECLEKTLALLRVELRHAKVEWVRDDTPDLPKVLGDEKQLGQLFLNLFLNAIEAMPRGGTLRASTHRQAERCEIQISDTGIGMSKEEQARIFEPFYTGKEHGLGLGLAIVGEIVSQHNGTISVESEKGKGTTFTVGLRVAE